MNRKGSFMNTRKQTSSRKTLLAEIDELERHIGGMAYMDEEDGMAYMDEDDLAVELDDVAVEDLDADPVEVVDEMSYMDDEDMEPGCMQASEEAPGIEDEITQDSLSEVEDLRDKEGLATEPNANAAARNTTPPAGSHPMWASEYVKRLKKASAHLDRVATHVEESGDKELALRIDKIADAIDKRANHVARRA
jgi:hypothetical protein